MTPFRYRAWAGGAALSGWLEAPSPAAARAALRDRGLVVLRVRARRAPGPLASAARGALASHLRRRRVPARADLFEDLAELLDTGVPLAEAVGVLETSAEGRVGSRRRLLREIADGVRGGDSFSATARRLPAWFDAADTAMLQAAEHAGSMPEVLRSLGARHARAGELTRRVATALAYPIVVLAVGMGVVVFLGQVTLPRLAGLLNDAGVGVPVLTGGVIRVGGFLGRWWFVAIGLLPLLAAGAIAWRAAAATGRVRLPDRVRRLVPRAARRAALAGMFRELALALRCGVPLVEALRVIAPTVRGIGASGLRCVLVQAAGRVERGEDLSAALDDPVWFGPALRRSLQVGENVGLLPEQLDRLAEAEARRARSLADRLAAMLEPAAVLTLAAMIGLVVLAAVQPLVKLQEVIR